MSPASSTPARPRFDRFRFDRFRFDKARATLSLLLLSAAVLGSLALQQSGRLPAGTGRAAPSVWDGAGTVLPPQTRSVLPRSVSPRPGPFYKEQAR